MYRKTSIYRCLFWRFFINFQESQFYWLYNKVFSNKYGEYETLYLRKIISDVKTNILWSIYIMIMAHFWQLWTNGIYQVDKWKWQFNLQSSGLLIRMTNVYTINFFNSKFFVPHPIRELKITLMISYKKRYR